MAFTIKLAELEAAFEKHVGSELGVYIHQATFHKDFVYKVIRTGTRLFILTESPTDLDSVVISNAIDLLNPMNDINTEVHSLWAFLTEVSRGLNPKNNG